MAAINMSYRNEVLAHYGIKRATVDSLMEKALRPLEPYVIDLRREVEQDEIGAYFDDYLHNYDVAEPELIEGSYESLTMRDEVAYGPATGGGMYSTDPPDYPEMDVEAVNEFSFAFSVLFDSDKWTEVADSMIDYHNNIKGPTRRRREENRGEIKEALKEIVGGRDFAHAVGEACLTYFNSHNFDMAEYINNSKLQIALMEGEIDQPVNAKGSIPAVYEAKVEAIEIAGGGRGPVVTFKVKALLDDWKNLEIDIDDEDPRYGSEVRKHYGINDLDGFV